MAEAIWKDTTVDLGASAVDFNIYTGGVVIYSGRAVPRPGGNAVLHLADIAAAYIDTPELTFEEDFQAMPSMRRNFEVRYGSSGSVVKDIYNDWSYKAYDAVVNGAHVHINGHICKGVYLPFSIYGAVSLVEKVNGTTKRTISATGAGTALFDDTYWHEGDSVVINNNYVHTVIPACRVKAALYYVNAYGGWDVFLIEGNARKSDSYERRSVATDRREAVYGNDITRRWELSTHLLTDAEEARMFHLLGTTKALLQDMADGSLRPVVIDTADCTFKTYEADGLIEHTIICHEAQQMERR